VKATAILSGSVSNVTRVIIRIVIVKVLMLAMKFEIMLAGLELVLTMKLLLPWQLEILCHSM